MARIFISDIRLTPCISYASKIRGLKSYASKIRGLKCVIGVSTGSKNSRKLKYGKCEKNHLNNRISKQQALSQWSNIA
jgi:hypothetical protein